MDTLALANSWIVYLVCAVVVIYVFFLCILYLRQGLRRAKELGISQDAIRSTIRSSAGFSIAPSIPIILALMAMMGVLGIPFPWMRLSIIGSFQYELMTANIGASAMGVTQLGSAHMTPRVLANSFWVMTLGIPWGMLLSIFTMRRFASGLDQARKKDATKLTLIITALYFGMLSVFVGPPLVQGGLPLYTLLVSAATFLVLNALAKRSRIGWLSDYVFTFSMLGGMVFSVLISL